MAYASFKGTALLNRFFVRQARSPGMLALLFSILAERENIREKERESLAPGEMEGISWFGGSPTRPGISTCLSCFL